MTDWREELVEQMADAMFASDENGTLRVDAMARAALAVAEPVIREQEDNALLEENARLREVIDEAYKSLRWMLIEGIDDAIIKTCPEEYNSTVDTLESLNFALVAKLDDEDAFALQYLRRRGAEAAAIREATHD